MERQSPRTEPYDCADGALCLHEWVVSVQTEPYLYTDGLCPCGRILRPRECNPSAQMDIRIRTGHHMFVRTGHSVCANTAIYPCSNFLQTLQYL
jgi:hypothetical protein